MSVVQRRQPAERSPSAGLVRFQLNKILSSEFFSRSDRLSAFLTFIVEQTLDGHGDTLKEQVIAIELYGNLQTSARPPIPSSGSMRDGYGTSSASTTRRRQTIRS